MHCHRALMHCRQCIAQGRQCINIRKCISLSKPKNRYALFKTLINNQLNVKVHNTALTLEFLPPSPYEYPTQVHFFPENVLFSPD